MSTPEQKERYKLKAREKRAKLRKQTKNDIVCRLCNLPVNTKGMSNHLKNVHELEFNTYLTEYLTDFEIFGWVQCSVCKKITKGTTCSRKCMGIMYKELYNGREPWNKNLTKETNESLKRMGESVSKSNTGNPKLLGNNNPATRPEVRAKMSKTRLDRGLGKGTSNGMFGKTHTVDAIKKIFANRSMTKPEQQLKAILDKLQIAYKSQFFITVDSKTFSYDFYLPAYNIIIEVDGDYWHGGPGVKEAWFGVKDTKQKDTLKDKIAIEQGYGIIRIWESELKTFPQIFINTLQSLKELK